MATQAPNMSLSARRVQNWAEDQPRSALNWAVSTAIHAVSSVGQAVSTAI